MSDIVLLHGFATGVRYSVFRDRYGADAGFSAFREDIASGKAKAFLWNHKLDASFWQSLNPWFSWRLYQDERASIHRDDVHASLRDFLAREHPRVIVCHSLGCQMLLEQINRFGLPVSVRHAVFVQADVDATFSIAHQDILLRLQNKNLALHNLFCPWDPSLLVSSAAHRSWRAGQRPASFPGVQNRFFPLLRDPNLHAGIIRDPRLRKFVLTSLL